MSIDLKRFHQLQQAVKTAQSDADRAAGQLEGVMARLKSEFGVATLTAAEKLATKLAAEAEAAEMKFADALEEFEAKWTNHANA